MPKQKNNFSSTVRDYSHGLITSLPPRDIPAGGAVYPKEDLLGQVLRIGRVAQAVVDHPEHAGLVPLDQLGERRRLAPLEGQHQPDVLVLGGPLGRRLLRPGGPGTSGCQLALCDGFRPPARGRLPVAS